MNMNALAISPFLLLSALVAASQDGCFDWNQLGDGFQIKEVACQFCHNLLTLEKDGRTLLTYESQFLTKLDLEVHGPSGEYQGKIDFVRKANKFKMRIYDCNDIFVGQIEERKGSYWQENFQLKTKMQVKNSSGVVIAFSTNKNLKREGDDDNSSAKTKKIDFMDRATGQTVWQARRPKGQDWNSIVCKDSKWEVKRVNRSSAMEIANPVFIAQLVALQGAREMGNFDSCSRYLITGLTFVAVALIAFTVCGVSCFKDTIKEMCTSHSSATESQEMRDAESFVKPPDYEDAVAMGRDNHTQENAARHPGQPPNPFEHSV